MRALVLAILLALLPMIAGCGEVTVTPGDTSDLGASVDGGADTHQGAEDTLSHVVPDAGSDATQSETHPAVDAGALSPDADPCAPKCAAHCANMNLGVPGCACYCE